MTERGPEVSGGSFDSSQELSHSDIGPAMRTILSGIGDALALTIFTVTLAKDTAGAVGKKTTSVIHGVKQRVSAIVPRIR